MKSDGPYERALDDARAARFNDDAAQVRKSLARAEDLAQSMTELADCGREYTDLDWSNEFWRCYARLDSKAVSVDGLLAWASLCHKHGSDQALACWRKALVRSETVEDTLSCAALLWVPVQERAQCVTLAEQRATRCEDWIALAKFALTEFRGASDRASPTQSDAQARSIHQWISLAQDLAQTTSEWLDCYALWFGVLKDSVLWMTPTFKRFHWKSPSPLKVCLDCAAARAATRSEREAVDEAKATYYLKPPGAGDDNATDRPSAH